MSRGDLVYACERVVDLVPARASVVLVQVSELKQQVARKLNAEVYAKAKVKADPRR